MKQRVLALIPCVLLFLGVLTGCSGNLSGTGTSQKFTGYDWHVQSTSGIAELDDLPTEVLYFVTLRFDSDGTGYFASMGQVYYTFQWYSEGNQLAMYIPGSGYGLMNYSVSGNSMVLREGTSYIRLIS